MAICTLAMAGLPFRVLIFCLTAFLHFNKILGFGTIALTFKESLRQRHRLPQLMPRNINMGKVQNDQTGKIFKEIVQFHQTVEQLAQSQQKNHENIGQPNNSLQKNHEIIGQLNKSQQDTNQILKEILDTLRDSHEGSVFISHS